MSFLKRTLKTKHHCSISILDRICHEVDKVQRSRPLRRLPSLEERQNYYNWFRSHGGLNGKTPTDRCHELLDQTPYLDEVLENYDISKERVQEQNDYIDLKIRKLKRCLLITHIMTISLIFYTSYTTAVSSCPSMTPSHSRCTIKDSPIYS
jgi:hypothetical protein